jgi:transposase
VRIGTEPRIQGVLRRRLHIIIGSTFAVMWRATYPFAGVIYVFRAKRADRVKLLVWDGTGLVLVSKRLDDGKFRWPRIEDGVMRLTAAQLSALIDHAS